MADSTNGDEDVVHHEANTKAFIQNQDLGVGDLYICKSCVRWQSVYEDKAVRLEYKRVPLHAVSRDGASFSLPCLFCVVDGLVTTTTRAEATVSASAGSREVNVVEMADEAAAEDESASASADAEKDEEEEDDEAEEGEEEDELTSEIRFAPEEPDHLDAMYSAMSQCQILHPDTDDEEDEHQLGDNGDSVLRTDIGSMEGFFTNPEDVVHLTAEGRRVLEHLNTVTVPCPEDTAADTPPEPGQFDDA